MLDKDFHLNDPREGVPVASRPVLFRRDASHEANRLTVDTWIAHYADRLPPGTHIDEAAILVPDPYHQAKLGEYLREGGWEHFNADTDVVYTNPFGTRYLVEYQFFRHPDVGYRLEVMMMVEDAAGMVGFSPLHQSLWRPTGRYWGDDGGSRYPIPHLSYKPVRSYLQQQDLGVAPPLQTWGQAYSQTVQHLQDKACIHAMTCQSQYGRFGYFIGNDTARQIYLKPRINTRDAS